MNAVLIDDDDLNVELLENLFRRYCPSVNVVGTADHVELALEVVIREKPDVIFLDIELHEKTARDLLNLIDLEFVQIIIISAFEKYALEMHKYPITDYLLKPVLIADLISAVGKVQRNMDKRKLKTELPVKPHLTQYIALPDKDQLHITSFDTIIRLEGMGNYTRIITNDEKSVVSSKTLGEYEELLPDEMFMRVHNSHIVNIRYVSKYLRTKNGSLVLSDGSEIPISANRKKDVTERIVF